MTNQNEFTVIEGQLLDLARLLDDTGQGVHDTAGRMGDHWAPQAWGYLLGQVFGLVAHTAMDILENSCLDRAELMHRDADQVRGIAAAYLGTDHGAATTFIPAT
ncbi:hypothetical protein [Actinokineospora enzanensis]|uniref:hypothetical protein n=1 Tax=Actinokineospora enzanensis TaxID=155975 RepID=UPI00036F4A5A|nr:hypothetical protein [Actinokineospora enzanensis]